MCPAHNIFFQFDTGLPYLAHGCITMKWCVVYILDPNITLTFDLNVKFTGFCLWPITIFLIWHWLTIFGTCVYHHESHWEDVLCTFTIPIQTLTFDLKVNFIGFCRVWLITSVCFDIGIPYLGTWVYHHEKMCHIHSWSWYNIDLWPRDQYRVYDMALCLAHSFFVGFVFIMRQ